MKQLFEFLFNDIDDYDDYRPTSTESLYPPYAIVEGATGKYKFFIRGDKIEKFEKDLKRVNLWTVVQDILKLLHRTDDYICIDYRAKEHTVSISPKNYNSVMMLSEIQNKLSKFNLYDDVNWATWIYTSTMKENNFKYVKSILL